MFEDIIFKLEDFMKGAKDSLLDLEEQVDEIEDTISNEQLDAFHEVVTDACRALSGIIELVDLQDGESPLRVIKHRLGPTLLGIDGSEFQKLIEAERALLKRIGLSEKAIQAAIGQMEEQANELLRLDASLNVEDVITTLEDFKNIVCEISNAGKKFKRAVDMETVKLCIRGLIDSCVITGDILSVFTVPDPTPFTFLRSVKSTYSGVKSLKTVSEKLYNRYKEQYSLIEKSFKPARELSNAEKIKKASRKKMKPRRSK